MKKKEIEKIKSMQGVLHLKDGTVITHYGDRITIIDKDGKDKDVPSPSFMDFADIKNVKYVSLEDKMKKNSVSNRDYLYSIFLEAKSIPNRTLLNDIVYISQEAGLVESNYPFRRSSSSIADPISSYLLVDLNYLEENNVIKNTIDGDSLVVIDQKYRKGDLISNRNKERLSRILNLSKEDLRTLGEIISLKENYLKQGLTRKEMVKNISYCIGISKANVSRGLKYFNNIKK